jgi:hypothetical protein
MGEEWVTYPTIIERDEALEDVHEIISNKEIEHPRDFRKSDGWDQYRFENVDDECAYCYNDNVLHLHHTTVPPNLERLIPAKAEELYKSSGRAAKFIRDAEERCRGCGRLHCRNGCDKGVGIKPQKAVELLSSKSIFTHSYEPEMSDDFADFVDDNIDNIVNNVMFEWQSYIDKYKSKEDTITLCGKCHYLRHRHNCKPCFKCGNITPKLARNHTFRWRCGVCLGTHKEESWEDVLENLINGKYDGGGSGLDGRKDNGEDTDYYRWKTSYDEIWKSMADNAEYF